MRVLTYASYKEHCELYTEIHGLIAVNSYQIELAEKGIILLWSVSVIFYKVGARTSVENNRFIKFSLETGTYSIGNFNAKIKAAVLQQRQDREPPQIKYLKLVIREHYTFMAPNTIFIALGILDKHLEKTIQIKSTLPPGTYKTLLDTSPPPKLLSLHYKQIKLKTSWIGNHQVC